MAKMFQRLPSEIYDPMNLMTPTEQFELNRDIWEAGITEEDRVRKQAIAEMKRINARKG